MIALPDHRKLASLHCAKKSSNDSNQIELAIIFVRRAAEWIVEKRVAVDPKSSDLNYIAKANLLVVASCSEICLFNALNLQMVKLIHAPRMFKRLSFLESDRYFAAIKKKDSHDSESIVSIYDALFNELITQRPIPHDLQPEIIRFIRYTSISSSSSGSIIQPSRENLLYACVPSDRLNLLILIDLHQPLPSQNMTSESVVERNIARPSTISISRPTSSPSKTTSSDSPLKPRKRYNSFEKLKKLTAAKLK